MESIKVGQAVMLAAVVALAACGGGGGGGDTSPPPPAVPMINAGVAVADLFNRLPAFDQVVHTEGAQFGWGSVSVSTEAGNSFVVNGAIGPATVVRKLQFNRNDWTGALVARVVWVLYIDPTNAKLLGAVMGDDLPFYWYKYTTCFASTSASSFPSSTNSNGVWASGFEGVFARAVRSGQSADYCDYQPSSPQGEWRWSVEAGSPYPYFCLQGPSTPVLYGLTTARLCFQTDSQSKLTSKAWVRVYSLLGSTYADYRSQ